VAMTGEITLRGRVLPIGGLKEKSVAAHRNRIANVLIPQRNARDLDEMPEEVKDAVSFHPVSSMDEVVAIAFRESFPRRKSSPQSAAALPPKAPEEQPVKTTVAKSPGRTSTKMPVRAPARSRTNTPVKEPAKRPVRPVKPIPTPVPAP
jgi:hypothetical protein